MYYRAAINFLTSLFFILMCNSSFLLQASCPSQDPASSHSRLIPLPDSYPFQALTPSKLILPPRLLHTPRPLRPPWSMPCVTILPSQTPVCVTILPLPYPCRALPSHDPLPSHSKAHASCSLPSWSLPLTWSCPLLALPCFCSLPLL